MKDEYCVNGVRATLPVADRNRFLSPSEFKRLLDTLIEAYNKALGKADELEEIIRAFNGKPAKAAFGKALEDGGFYFKDNSRITVLPASNCTLSDDGTMIVRPGNGMKWELENGILLCDSLQYDEEGLLDAEATISGEGENMQTTLNSQRRALEELSTPDADKWLDTVYEARELIRSVRRECPDELMYLLFRDLFDDVAYME